MRYCALSTTMKSLTRTYAQMLFQHFFGLHKVFAEPAIALHEVQEEAYGLRVDLRHDKRVGHQCTNKVSGSTYIMSLPVSSYHEESYAACTHWTQELEEVEGSSAEAFLE